MDNIQILISCINRNAVPLFFVVGVPLIFIILAFVWEYLYTHFDGFADFWDGAFHPDETNDTTEITEGK